MLACATVVVAAALAADAGSNSFRTDASGARAVSPGRGVANGGPTAGPPAGWEALGPFGGDMQDVSVSTTDPSIVLAGLAPSGGSGGTLYRSTDGGHTWAEVGALSGQSVYDIEYASNGTAYIATDNSVWRSADGGATWTMLNLAIGLNDVALSVAVDPNNDSVIWAGVADALGSQPVNLMKSINGGATWTDATPPLGSPLGGQTIAVDPADSDRVFAGFAGGFGGGAVWFSPDGGASWFNRSAGLPGNPVNALAIAPDGRVLVAGGQLFGSQDFGVYESSDNGVTWTALHDGSWPTLAINDVALEPGDPTTLLVAAAGAGLFRSDDSGGAWSFGVGGTAGQTLNSVRYAPGDASTVFLGASSTAIFRSDDGGANFEQSATGVGALNVFDVAANRLDENEIAIAFQGLNDGGVFTSTDGGTTWMQEPLPGTRYSAVGFAPNGVLYAISSGPTTVAAEGLYRRNANGTWTSLGPNQGGSFESDLATMRFSVNNPDLILLGGADFGVAGFEATVWRSTTAGASWTKVFESVAQNEEVTDIEIVEDGTDTVMVASFTDFAANTGGALRSTNGGASWAASNTGLPAQIRASALCSPAGSPQTIFLADNLNGGGGLWRSDNAGASWTALPGISRIDDLACDPASNATLYAAVSFGGPSVQRSEDSGVTFSPFDTGLGAAGTVRAIAHSSSGLTAGATGSGPRLLAATTTGAWATSLGGGVLGDLDGDGDVDGADLAILLGQWGAMGANPADLNGDGEVGGADLAILLGEWSPA